MTNAANTNANDINGSKYLASRDLDIKAIAKLVRADIKALKLPGVECSVSIERYSGGQSINVRVKAAPVQIWTDEYIAANPHDYFEGDRRTEEAQALLAALESTLQAYNMDRSDTQSDYFHVRFYGHAEFCQDLTSADRERTAARLAAPKAPAFDSMALAAAVMGL
jgi:hypothetical protein